MNSRRTCQPRTSRGFTLIEIAVVLVIIAIIITMAAVITRGFAAAQKRSLTATRLAQVDAALVQFVMQQKRLPCPADGRIAAGLAGAGTEAPIGGANPCTNSQQHGVVPWITLGLGEQDATDGWDRRLTYRVEITITTANGLDMSACDPAGSGPAGPGNSCASGCTSATPIACTPPSTFLASRGLQVKNVVGATLMSPPTTGAAYVVISHGETGGGAYLNTGAVSTSSVVDGLEEQKNGAAKLFQTYYVDDSTTDVSGPSHFDDIISRPTILSLVSKAGLAPRAH